MKTTKRKKQRAVSSKGPTRKRWTFKKSEKPRGWTEELERDWEESGPHTYDKAEWHYEGDFPKGHSEKQAYVHTGLFLGWLIERRMISREFIGDLGRNLRSVIERFKRKAITGPEAYEMWDGGLFSDMLTPEANDFAQHYYEGTRFATDYRKLLVRDLPSWYHVQDTWANYDILAPQIDARYEAWKRRRIKAKR
jgi:hypothetical protein